MKRHCEFMLLTTLALLGCAPALGQTVAPAGPTSSGTQDGAPVPDFSGTWVRPYFGVEPPLSGPGPVTNKLRCSKISQCAPFQGRDGVESYYGMVGDYTNPILKPQAADIVKKYGEIELSGLPNATARSECWPDGVPFVFAFEEGMHLLQQPDKITIVYDYDHQVRHVRMNEPHPARGRIRFKTSAARSANSMRYRVFPVGVCMTCGGRAYPGWLAWASPPT
jgi:hypothetical protein